MRHSKLIPEVNAGSMADIAFLLLIFINRTLPAECPPGVDCSSIKPERNILRIVINNNNDILVENDIVEIEDLKDLTKAFLDNNGDGSCNYCNGEQLSDASDNPKKAVISLQNGQQTSLL